MARYDVLVIGDLNPDIVVTGLTSREPHLGTEQYFDTMERTLGGSGALTSVTISRLGLSAALVARVGDDEPAAFCRAFLEREGVAPLLSTHSALATGVTIAFAYPADRLLLTSPGTIADLAADDVPAGLFGDVRHVHVSSYFMQKRLRAGLAGLFAAARAKGATTSLDTGWDPAGEWMDANLEAALAVTDLLLPNTAELTQLTGIDDPDAAAEKLLTLGAGSIVVKDGSRGAFFSSVKERHADPGFAVTPLDTTGAGDAFDAGYISAMLEGRSIPDSLRFANACGALVAGVRGGAGGNLKRADFDTMYESIR
jgi:sugar/nucleoside kinase (ribokinase family)